MRAEDSAPGLGLISDEKVVMERVCVWSGKGNKERRMEKIFSVGSAEDKGTVSSCMELSKWLHD
jgi:hypothetical protein